MNKEQKRTLRLITRDALDHLPDGRVSWTPRSLNFIKSLLEQGLSWADIGERLGVNSGSFKGSYHAAKAGRPASALRLGQDNNIVLDRAKAALKAEIKLIQQERASAPLFRSTWPSEWAEPKTKTKRM